MTYQPFPLQFPKLAEKETRIVTIARDDVIPKGSYAFVPLYCTDKTCDCRRALIWVIAEEDRKPASKPLAVISYGWEHFDFYRKWVSSLSDEMVTEFKGPALDSMQPQSVYAPHFLEIFSDIVRTDKDYAQRLVRHYAYFKYKQDMKMPRHLLAAVKPMEACACGSRRVFRLCCGKKKRSVARRRKR